MQGAEPFGTAPFVENPGHSLSGMGEAIQLRLLKLCCHVFVIRILRDRVVIGATYFFGTVRVAPTDITPATKSVCPVIRADGSMSGGFTEGAYFSPFRICVRSSTTSISSLWFQRMFPSGETITVRGSAPVHSE